MKEVVEREFQASWKQCDQIGQYFATLTKKIYSFANFWKLYLVFGKKSKIVYAIEQIFIGLNASKLIWPWDHTCVL